MPANLREAVLLHFRSPFISPLFEMTISSLLLFQIPSLASLSTLSADILVSFTEKVEGIRRELPRHPAAHLPTSLPLCSCILPSLLFLRMNSLCLSKPTSSTTLCIPPPFTYSDTLSQQSSPLLLPQLPLSMASFQSAYKQAVISPIFFLKELAKKNFSCLKKLDSIPPFQLPVLFSSVLHNKTSTLIILVVSHCFPLILSWTYSDQACIPTTLPILPLSRPPMTLIAESNS